jgi:hypothetical protein
MAVPDPRAPDQPQRETKAGPTRAGFLSPLNHREGMDALLAITRQLRTRNVTNVAKRCDPDLGPINALRTAYLLVMAVSADELIAEDVETERRETELERCDRNLVELLQEVRVGDAMFPTALTVVVTVIAAAGCVTTWFLMPRWPPANARPRSSRPRRYAATRRSLIRTASTRFWRTDSTLIE